MEASDQSEEVWLKVGLAVVGVGLFVARIVWDFRRRRRRLRPYTANKNNHKRAVTNQHVSALLSYYTHAGQVMPVDEGTVDGMHYMAYLSSVDNAVIYRVELPFGSKTHLLGVPKLSDAKQIDPTGPDGIFEKVSLEGDYDRFFSLYCQKGQQVDTRYLLDPKAMAYTVDFCQSHSWELIDSELYFAQTGRNHPGDTTSMFEDVSAFVANIRPAVERPLTQRELLKITPYGRDRRDSLKCPTCQQVMVNEQTHYRCINHHGVLLMGRYLTELRDGRLTIETQDTKAALNRPNIKCPSCDSTMKPLSYNGSMAVIDSCPGCPYRWLDGADVARIAS